MELTALFFVFPLYSLCASGIAPATFSFLLDCNSKAGVVSYFFSVRIKKEGRETGRRNLLFSSNFFDINFFNCLCLEDT